MCRPERLGDDLGTGEDQKGEQRRKDANRCWVIVELSGDQEVVRLEAEVIGIQTGLEAVQSEMVEIENNIETVAMESENIRAGMTSEIENLTEGLATSREVFKKELDAELARMRSALEVSDQDRQSLENRISALEGQLESAQQDRINLATRHLMLEEVLKDLANTQQLLEKAIQRIENPPPDLEK